MSNYKFPLKKKSYIEGRKIEKKNKKEYRGNIPWRKTSLHSKKCRRQTSSEYEFSSISSIPVRGPIYLKKISGFKTYTHKRGKRPVGEGRGPWGVYRTIPPSVKRQSLTETLDWSLINNYLKKHWRPRWHEEDEEPQYNPQNTWGKGDNFCLLIRNGEPNMRSKNP